MAKPIGRPSGLPPRTALYLLVGAGVLLLFVLLGVGPMQKRLGELDLRIREARFQIEEQHALQPIFQKMLAIVRAKGAKAKPAPPHVVLNQDQISRVTDTLAGLIVAGGLEAVAVTPDPSSLDKGSKALSVAIHVRGDMERFRLFLDTLSDQAFFQNVENVRVLPGASARDFQIKVWLAAE